MNFKSLENERQYKYTKKCAKGFKKENKEIDNTIYYKIHQKEQTCLMINILEAEIRDYEYRKQKEKDMIIDVEEIFAIEKIKKKINSLPLEKITFCYKGRKVNVDKAGVKEWKMTGLTNFDFIRSYEKEIKKNLTAGTMRIIRIKGKSKYSASRPADYIWDKLKVSQKRETFFGDNIRDAIKTIKTK